MSRADSLYKQAEETRNRISNFQKALEEENNNLREQLHQYRIESVDRVLDFLRTEYRAGRVCNLETLLCHCKNKLHGNIDGVELCLDERYVDEKFQRVGEQNGKINGKNTYRRIAIRKKRYPISQAEAERLEQYQKNYHISDAELGRKGCDISNMGGYEFAGKIFSYLDSKKNEVHNTSIDEISGGGE